MPSSITEYSPPEEFFKRMRLKRNALKSFGFLKKPSGWEHSAPVADGSLVCTISIDGLGKVAEKVVDSAADDEYVQHRVAAATGKFVGRVRRDVMALMTKVAKECFERDVFKTDEARRIIEFARAEWGETLEFLWDRFPDYAVLRRSDTGKWYALVARLAADKVGGNAGEEVEVVNLRRADGMAGERFRPAYHMNKKTWTTIVLDGSMTANELMMFVTASREKAE